MKYKRNITSRFPCNSEANDFDFPERMFFDADIRSVDHEQMINIINLPSKFFFLIKGLKILKLKVCLFLSVCFSLCEHTGKELL